ncbi:unnamed protein product [Effrenium voratum]|nr:unnamed protein product [Effrenium voratum]
MSMRSFCYPALFKMNLLTVTCYSVPMRQYVNMGRHHPCYMGEDCMVAAQSSVDASRCATVAMLPVLVEVAPPLDSNCCGALRETARQCVRWAAQSTEAAEFRWRFRGPRSTLGTAWWLLKYWFVRVAMMNALGAFAISLSVAVQLDIALPELESWVLLVMDKFLLVVVLALFVVMPVYEQLLAQLARHEVPWRQLPATILSFPGAVLANTVVDLWAWHKLLSRGKAAITLTHRKKIVAKDPALCLVKLICTFAGTRAAQWRPALGLFEQLEGAESEVAPDVLSYGAGILACGSLLVVVVVVVVVVVAAMAVVAVSGNQSFRAQELLAGLQRRRVQQGADDKAVQRLEDCLQQEAQLRQLKLQSLKKEVLHPKLTEAQGKLEAAFLHQFEYAHNLIDAVSDRLAGVEKDFVQSRARYVQQIEMDAGTVASDLKDFRRSFEVELAARQEREQDLRERLAASKHQMAEKLARDDQLADRKFEQLFRGAGDSVQQRDSEQRRFKEQLDGEIESLKSAIADASKARSQADDDIVAALNHYTKELQQAVSSVSQGSLQAALR